MKPRDSREDNCPQCGRAISAEQGKLDIAIEKGHVRRASQAADSVYAAAGGEQAEHGVVFMTAILLIERLATAQGCDPRRVIHHIGYCFDFKDRHVPSDGPCN